jgi:hypothetical protein
MAFVWMDRERPWDSFRTFGGRGACMDTINGHHSVHFEGYISQNGNKYFISNNLK